MACLNNQKTETKGIYFGFAFGELFSPLSAIILFQFAT